MSDYAGSPEEAARKIGASPDYVRDLIKKNEIPHVRLGPRKVVIPWRALDDWLDERARSSVKPTTTKPVLGLVADGGPPGS